MLHCARRTEGEPVLAVADGREVGCHPPTRSRLAWTARGPIHFGIALITAGVKAASRPEGGPGRASQPW